MSNVGNTIILLVAALDKKFGWSLETPLAIIIAGITLSVCHDAEWKEKDIDVKVAVSIAGQMRETDRIRLYEMPGIEQAVCIIHRGPYEELKNTYQSAIQWFDNNGYEISGSNHEVYLPGPGESSYPSTFVTEIQIPARKK